MQTAFVRGSWQVRTKTYTLLTCDKDHFFIHAELDAYEGEKRVYCRNWDYKIRRALV